MSDIGLKNSRGNMGFQILNVGQIFMEKSQKRPKAFNFLILILKVDV